MRFWASLLAALALAGCSTGGSAAPDAASLLRQSASAMASVRSLAADVKFGPGIVYQGFTLASAQTQIALPSTSDTTLKVRQQDFLVDVRVVTVNGQVFVKVPFGQFQQLTPRQSAEVPNLALLFDAQKGLPALLASGRDARYLGTEKVGSTDCDQVSATYTAAQVAALISGLKPASDISATLWLGRSDHRLYRVLLAGELVQAGQKTSVDVTVHDYGAPVNVVAPSVAPSP